MFQQLFDSVEAKQYKRPDMNRDLRLGFALNDFAGTKWKNLTGTARWRIRQQNAAAGLGARTPHFQRGGEGVSGRPPNKPGPAAERLLANMKAFGGKPDPFMLVAIDALTTKWPRSR